jgi:hypothetical protein
VSCRVWWCLVVGCVWVCVWLGGGVGQVVLFPLALLHDLCAGSSGLLMSAGTRWSAVQGSWGLAGSLQIQQIVALSLTVLAALR